MGRWSLILASSALLIATSAHAQLVNATGSGSSDITLDGDQYHMSKSFTLWSDETNSGSSFETKVKITPDYVSFESGNAVAGPWAYSVSTSSVDVGYTNLGTSEVSPVFESTIIPAGLGFYLQDRSGGCGGNPFTGCPEALSPYTFSDITPAVANGQPFAMAGFNFTINEGDTELYTLSGYVSLAFDGDELVVINNLGAASSFLNGFTQVTPLGSQTGLAFAWDSTDFLVELGRYVAPNESTTLTYTATVFSATYADCIDPDVCLVAYSGFGDPIGRGGGVESLASFNLHSSFNESFQAFDSNSGITGISFDPVQFQPFRIHSEGGPGAVPEPATWALMLLGFGALGATLRRRRALAHS